MAKNKDKPDLATDHQNGSDQIDFQSDEFRGLGGSYVVDPDTGKRQRVSGPELQQPATEIEESNEEISHANEGQ